MAKTAFSQFYKCELDPEQLLARIAGSTVETFVADAEILPEIRDWIRSDIVCPCCGVPGAQIVRTSTSRKTAKASRQSHFRFPSQTDESAHLKFCEFRVEDIPQTNETLINFTASRSAEALFVRDLVCKGIETAVFDQTSIRAMRQWFYNLKSDTRVFVSATPQAIDWMDRFWRHAHYDRWQFHPVHAEMPGFDWKKAAAHQFGEDHHALHDWFVEQRRRAAFPIVFKRAKVLAEKYLEQEVLDTTVLHPFYDKTLRLACFVARHSDFPNKKDPVTYRSTGAPTALLALCALVLFVSDWKMDDAIGHIARLLKVPPANDDTLGNVIGLNPFHDYAAWETIKLATELAAKSPAGMDYPAQLAAIESRLRQQHAAWRVSQTE